MCAFLECVVLFPPVPFFSFYDRLFDLYERALRGYKVNSLLTNIQTSQPLPLKMPAEHRQLLSVYSSFHSSALLSSFLHCLEMMPDRGT